MIWVVNWMIWIMHNFINKASIKHLIVNWIIIKNNLFLSYRFSFTLLFQSSLLIINHSLFSLYIFKHIFVLWQSNIIREYSRILFIKLKNFRQPRSRFCQIVAPFQELWDVIKNEVVFKDGYNMSIFIIYHIVDDLNVVKIFRCHVFREILLKNSFHCNCTVK